MRHKRHKSLHFSPQVDMFIVKDQDTIDLRCSLIFTDPTTRTGTSLPGERLRRKERMEDGSTILDAQVLTKIDSRRH